MKDKILAALKAKFQGVNTNILDRIATMLAKTVTTEEQVTTAVEGVTQDLISVIEAYGDSRATDAQKTAVSNYESKYGLKDGQKIDTTTTTTTTTETPPATPPAGGDPAVTQMLQQLLDQNKKFEERLNKMDGERTTTSRKQKLDELLSKLPENLRKGYSRTPLDGTDEEWNTRLAEVTNEVNELAGSVKVRGAVFGRPSAQGNPNQDGKLTEAQEKAINQRTGVPADGQQPF